MTEAPAHPGAGGGAISSAAAAADLDDLLTAFGRHIEQRRAAHGGVPTFYDNHVRRTAAALAEGTLPADRHGDAVRLLRDYVALTDAPRFCDPRPRLARSRDETAAAMAVPPEIYAASQGIGAVLRWRGLPLFKTVYDLAAYPMLLDELRPATVLEFGSGTGASAQWLADIAACHALQPRIVSIDRRPVPCVDDRITFLTGDVADLPAVLPQELTRTFAHPWLVIEDVHACVDQILTAIDQLLQPGDYLLVEDSLPKRDELRNLTASGTYLLDTRYTDLFGQNTTCAPDSILRKTDTVHATTGSTP
jgi:cephalosporin hydroxylase